MMSLLGWAAVSSTGIPGYAALAVLLTVAGISSAGLHAVAPVMAGRYSGKSLGRGMGFWMVGGELGRTLGPIVIVTGVAILTLEGTALLMIVGFMTSAFLFVRLKDAPTPATHSKKPLGWRHALGRMRSLMAPLISLIFARSFMAVSLAVYLPTFLTEEGASLWMAGASLSVLELSGVVGALMGGSLSDRFGRRRVLLLATLTAPIFLYMLLSIRGWLLFPVLLLSGFTLLSTVPVIMALVQESFPENRALANGVYMSISFTIRSIAIVVVGAIGDLVGLRWAYVISGVLMWVGVPLVLLLPTPPNRQHRR
jgi:FSR family fosmidomycin resistance protein-like MFS transporter